MPGGRSWQQHQAFSPLTVVPRTGPVLSGVTVAIYTVGSSASLLRWLAASSASQEGWVVQCAPFAPPMEVS